MQNHFRFPERLGAFSIWISPEVYPLAETARLAGEAHRALVRDRTRLTLPGTEMVDLASDEEFLVSATGFYRRLEELWEGLERQQTLASVRGMPLVRRLFLASAAEWALDLHYEVRAVEPVEKGAESRWKVIGRAWDGERPHDRETLSAVFAGGDTGAGELALIEALGRTYTGAIAGLIGWVALDPDTVPPHGTS